MTATTANAFASIANELDKPVKEAKAPNYTPEQTAYMVGEYLADKSQKTVERLALEMARTARSIIAKLSREKVYAKPAYKTKTGEPSVQKNEHADAIGAVLNLGEADTSSLAKCNKVALAAIWKAISNSVPATPENTAKVGATAPFQRGEYSSIAESSDFDTE